MNSGFVRNLRTGYGISVLLLLISGAASFISINNLLESAKLVSHTQSVLQQLETESSVLKDAETGQRGFLLTGDRIFLKPYEGAAVRATELLQTMETMIADNPVQQKNIDLLRSLVNAKFLLLQDLINRKNTGLSASNMELREGNDNMIKIRDIIAVMKMEENRLLVLRTTDLGKIVSFVPFVIISASLLGLLITIFSYTQVMSDFNERVKLQANLVTKDREITNRIEIIQKIAGDISAGDYNIRINADQKDDLGVISASLNKMAASLDSSFRTLSEKEWLQTGIASLQQQMLGEMNVKGLCNNIILAIAEYTNSQVGGIYLAEGNMLNLEGAYALLKTAANSCFARGEGIIGQCAEQGKPLFINEVAGKLEINFS
ncbi:MAG: CHASE3 domain-containing protein, partial [Bacteroidota bacterium]